MQGDLECICDVSIVLESEWNLLSDDLKEFIIAKASSFHLGESCGCVSEPATTKNILGKDYNNVCSLEVYIVNSALTLWTSFKEVVKWLAINI